MPLNEQEIFEKALDIGDAAEREAFLAESCGNDVNVIREVESLLDSARDVGSFMAKQAAGSLEVNSDPELPGGRRESIGNYKLLEQIGEGGFGVVYMAEQQAPIQRRVALKIIKAGMDTKQVIARFEAERQALALMDHPNIAKVLDAGATEEERPFFVMELVRGVPITDYCDKHNLSTEQRLRLFVLVCFAIQHAHQKGIIHRDIKPNNILVTTNGRQPFPMVIDFGIAKATQGRLTDKTLFTSFRQFIGTPTYMSPEQAQMSAVDVDTRSDIYSLGVLLYELVTGRTPLDSQELQEARFEELFRRIREDEASKPSLRLSSLTQDELSTVAKHRCSDPSRLFTEVKGDLDWIVMKAMDKDRSRRYPTAESFAQDILRHLDGDAVTAVPPGGMYLLRKFARRNRRLLVTTLAIMGSLLLGTIGATWGWVRAVNTKEELASQVTVTHAALDEAQTAKKFANAERKRAVRAAYLADIQAAHQALRLKNLGLARRLLQRTRDFDPDFDPRHWEWRALWAQCRGNVERSFGGGAPVNSLSIHPDGKWVAVGGPTIRVWDMFAGTIVHEFKLQGIGKAHFSPSGDRLYTTEESGSVRAWDVPSFEPADFLLSHGGPFDYRHDMQVAPNGELLATYSGTRGEITIWDTQTQSSEAQVPNDTWNCPLAFSADSSKLALGGPPIRIIDLQSMDVTRLVDREVPHWSGKQALVFSPDGQHIASAMGAGGRPEFMIHRLSDGHRIARVREHRSDAMALAYSLDGTLIASASLDQTVLLWDARSHQVIAELREHDLGVAHVAFSPDGQRLVSGGNDGKICVWNLADIGQNKWPISTRGLHTWNASTPQVSCSPDGTVLATTHTKKNDKPGVTLLSTKDLREVRTLAESSGIVRGVLYSPVDDLLVISNQDGALEFISPKVTDKSDPPVVFAAGTQTLPVQFTPDGQRLLVVVRDRVTEQEGTSTTCALYSVSDQSLIASWSIPKETCVAVSPDGKRIVTGHKDGLRFWLLDDLQQSTHVLVGGQGDRDTELIWSVAFSPDGAYVVGGTNRTGRIVIFDALAMRPLGHIAGHIQHIGAVKFSPDGKRLASGGHTSFDALKLWDFESRREIMSLSVDSAWSARAIEWLPDGNSIMLLNGDSKVSIWRAHPSKKSEHGSRCKPRKNRVSSTLRDPYRRRLKLKELMKVCRVIPHKSRWSPTRANSTRADRPERLWQNSIDCASEGLKFS